MEPETMKGGKFCKNNITETHRMIHGTKYFLCDKIITGKYIILKRENPPLILTAIHFNEFYVYAKLIDQTIQHGKN